MSTYSNRLQPALQNLTCCSVVPPEKITHKASDAAENLQLYGIVRFFHPRSSCTTTHIISADVQRITLNESCMTISGARTEQLDSAASLVYE